MKFMKFLHGASPVYTWYCTDRTLKQQRLCEVEEQLSVRRKKSSDKDGFSNTCSYPTSLQEERMKKVTLGALGANGPF